VTAAQGLETAVRQGPVRVLVVDDTPALRRLMGLVLEGTGFEVVGEAGDGLAAIAESRRLQPDLVLLDLAMPVMDGLEALPQVREEVPGARIVIVSGFDRRAMESQVVEAGADGYVQKGLPPDAMVETLRALFPDAPEPAAPDARPVPAPPARAVDDDAERRIQSLENDLEELLYVVSHDLSEPVHVVRGFAERLARRVRSDEEGEFCEFIVDAADRMQRLLDDLLEYARAGRGELRRELLDPRRLVDQVVAGLATPLGRSGGRVTVGELPHSVVGSRLVLTQVLHNLVGNGVKFVRPGVPPHVVVEGWAAEGTAVFRVQDNGIGIDREQVERVFQPFTRLNTRDAYPGSGVGLAICRRLIERSGGRIWVEESSEGSCFAFEVPS
jgi:signal transduction histidine kinase